MDAMTDEVSLRAGTPGDAPCLGVLGLQVFLDTYATEGIRPTVAREVLAAFSTDRMLGHLQEPDTAFVVAERRDHLVGFAQLTLGQPQERVTAQRPCELFRLYMQEPFTGRGLGTRLLQAAEALAAARGATAIWLRTWVHNRRALAFYAARGFTDVGAAWYRFEGEAHENRVLVKPLPVTS